ncbi:MAG: alpha/beta fold hydrolase [Victivallales bacterium]|nr:alpha/beta fold hydrolase [Victivallales bacterium]
MTLKDFPFESRWQMLSTGHKLHYVDEGSGVPAVMLHGNPTWCYMYRKLIKSLADKGRRAIAFDHLGCGFSDKPKDEPFSMAQVHLDFDFGIDNNNRPKCLTYCLQSHLDNMTEFIDAVLPSGDPFDLIVHDWGGPIGFAYAERHPERIRHIVLMNTVAWMSRTFPKSIYLTKCPLLGALLVRHLNVLIHVALKKMPIRPLPSEVLAAYRLPYRNYHDRIAIQRFPQDIPLGPNHPSYRLFQKLEENLHILSDHPMLALWGMHDFCFPPAFLRQWQERFPNLKTQTFPDASHFLLEDLPQEVITTIMDFLKTNK